MQEGKARLMQPVALLCRQSIHQGLQMGLGKTHSLPLRPLCRVVIPDPVVSRWHLPKISANQEIRMPPTRTHAWASMSQPLILFLTSQAGRHHWKINFQGRAHQVSRLFCLCCCCLNCKASRLIQRIARGDKGRCSLVCALRGGGCGFCCFVQGAGSCSDGRR